MFDKLIFSVVATQASSILISSSKKKQKKKQPLCPETVLVDSHVSDRCPWATCLYLTRSMALAVLSNTVSPYYSNEQTGLFLSLEIGIRQRRIYQNTFMYVVWSSNNRNESYV